MFDQNTLVYVLNQASLILFKLVLNQKPNLNAFSLVVDLRKVSRERRQSDLVQTLRAFRSNFSLLFLSA